MKPTFLTNESLVEQHMDDAELLLAPVVREAGRGEFTLADIRRMTLSGACITCLVREDDGTPALAFAFHFVHYPQRLAVAIIALGGHDVERAAAAYWPTFLEWCAAAGADMIEAACSPAMARLLKKLQFAREYELVRLTINQPRREPC